MARSWPTMTFLISNSACSSAWLWSRASTAGSAAGGGGGGGGGGRRGGADTRSLVGATHSLMARRAGSGGRAAASERELVRAGRCRHAGRAPDRAARRVPRRPPLVAVPGVDHPRRKTRVKPGRAGRAAVRGRVTGRRRRADAGARGRGGGTVAAMRVLVVDDEVDLAEAVARGLRREGYAVDVAYDGDEALDKVCVNAYDLVCLDITMPGTDGLEVCRQIRAADGPGAQPRVLDAHRPRRARRPRRRPRRRRRRLPGQAVRLPRAARPGCGRCCGATPAASTSVLAGRPTSSSTPPATRRRRGERPLDLTAKEFALLRYFMAHAGRGPLPGDAARARVGRARRPVHQHRAGHGRDPAPQAGRPATRRRSSRR